MNPSLLEILNYLQGINIEDKKQIYRICCEFIPIDKRYYPYKPAKENNELDIKPTF